MEVKRQYQLANRQTPFQIKGYITPAMYFDPKREIMNRKNADYKNRPFQGKFKPTQKHKKFFMDKQIQPLIPYPSPDKYKTITNREGFFDTDRKQKLRKFKSVSHLDKKGEGKKKLIRGSFFDDIEKFQAKYKPPPVGKYNLDTKSASVRHIVVKPVDPQQKYNNLDDIKYVSSTIPGVGHYNPHKSVPHLKFNDKDLHYYKTKHAEEQQKKTKKLNQTKVTPVSYTPNHYHTFDEIKKNKKNFRSRWSHGPIDIRSGLRSQYKSPSPSDHQVINQWSPSKSVLREKDYGKINLLNKTTRSFKSLSVYH